MRGTGRTSAAAAAAAAVEDTLAVGSLAAPRKRSEVGSPAADSSAEDSLVVLKDTRFPGSLSVDIQVVAVRTTFLGGGVEGA